MLPSSALRVSAMLGTPARLLPNFTALTLASRRLISTTQLAPSRESMKSDYIQQAMKKAHKERRLDDSDTAVDIDAIAEEVDGLGGEEDGEFQRFPDDDIYHKGPLTYDVHNVLRYFDPPDTVIFMQLSSTLSFWGTPSPPSTLDRSPKWIS